MRYLIIWLIICLSALAACSKSGEVTPKTMYFKSGIWNITKATVSYFNTGGSVDSMKEYHNVGTFLFYNMDIYDAPDFTNYLGQRIVDYGSTHQKEGIWWHITDGKLYMGNSSSVDTNHVPDRIYEVNIVDRRHQTWQYLLPSTSTTPGFRENFELEEIKYK